MASPTSVGLETQLHLGAQYVSELSCPFRRNGPKTQLLGFLRIVHSENRFSLELNGTTCSSIRDDASHILLHCIDKRPDLVQPIVTVSRPDFIVADVEHPLDRLEANDGHRVSNLRVAHLDILVHVSS